MALFGKKTQQLPVNDVLSLRQKGVADNQIVQELQQKGFTTQQIFEAMSQADLQSGTAGAMPAAPPPGAMPAAPPPGAMPVAPPPPMPAQVTGASIPTPQQYVTPQSEQIEELVETVVNEKWDEFLKEVEKIVAWKDRTESTLTKLKEEIETLKKNFTELHQGVLGKVQKYDENIRNVNAQLEAVQNVFKDVIPEFTENVAELSRITKGMNKKTTKK